MAEDPSPQTRVFSYHEACELLPEVQRMTEEAYRQVSTLVETLPAAGDERERIQAQVDAIVRGWLESVTGLGIEVKGLWLVDFDNGSGYYCWRYPEPALQYYHSYEEGFRGRVRIQ